MTLTRATLGKLRERKTTDLVIDGHNVRLQKPTPLEFTQYQMGLVTADGKADLSKFGTAISLLTARMWIDGDGNRLFSDKETTELASLDLGFYQQLSAECQKFASPEASTALGESEKTTDSDSLVESVSSLE
jgi:hypothetical protein